MKIELYNNNAREWDEYVNKTSHSNIYHKAGWKRIFEDFFEHKTFYLMAKEDGDIKGVLPLVLMKSRVFGKFIVSLPFHCIAGVCAEDENSARCLIDEAIQITKEEKTDYLELRNVEERIADGLITENHKASFILDLTPGIDKLWQGFKKQIRNRIRKAEKNNFSIKFGHEYIKEFYDCYATHMRDIGLPVHNFVFFRKVLEVFPKEETQISIITHSGKTIASKFFMLCKDTVYLMCGASLKDEKELMPNYLLTWEVIKYAANAGYKYLDFGRSTINTGPYYFKQSWGGQLKPLYWQYHLNNGNKMPELNTDSRKFKIASSIWKKLPVSVTKFIGPRIVKYIP